MQGGNRAAPATGRPSNLLPEEKNGLESNNV